MHDHILKSSLQSNLQLECFWLPPLNIKRLNIASFCLGGVPADVPSHLRRAVEDLHSAGGGRLCQGDAGQPSHNHPRRLPPGGRQTAVHRQDCGKPALHKPR